MGDFWVYLREGFLWFFGIFGVFGVFWGMFSLILWDSLGFLRFLGGFGGCFLWFFGILWDFWDFWDFWERFPWTLRSFWDFLGFTRDLQGFLRFRVLEFIQGKVFLDSLWIFKDSLGFLGFLGEVFLNSLGNFWDFLGFTRIYRDFGCLGVCLGKVFWILYKFLGIFTILGLFGEKLFGILRDS